MNRRHFVASSGVAVLTALCTRQTLAQPASNRQYLQLQKFVFDNDGQKQAFHAYMKEAAIPALNRLGLKPVGVFVPDPSNPPKDPAVLSSVYVLIPHPSLESAAELQHQLLADTAFTSKAEAFLDAPKSAPPYKEIETWLMLAFKGMPQVQTPAKGPDRVFQLRTYESPSLKTAQKKIEMFNDAGEMKLFREVGLTPVFFGEVLFGGKMPNLTYMLGFDNADAMKAGWKKFGPHPEWKKLSSMPEYADARIIRNITNIVCKPADYSQI